MHKNKPNFHPVTKALSMLELNRYTLENSRDYLKTMHQAKDRPHILDDDIINRSIKLHTAQNEDSKIFLEQCAIWRKESLTEVYLYQVEELEKTTHELINTNNEILVILYYCKDRTINKILEKDDLELVLEMLTGKFPFPK